MGLTHTRRQFLKVGGIASVVGLAGCAEIENEQPQENGTTPTAPSSDTQQPEKEDASESFMSQGTWPMFQHDVRNSGYSPDAQPPENLEEIWRFEIAESEVFNHSPVVVNDVVYLAHSHLFALDGSNGELLWKTEERPHSSSPAPVFIDNMICADGKCFDIKTGELSKDFGRTGYMTIKDKTAVIATFGGIVYGFDVDGESQLWEFGTDDFINNVPAIANGLVYVGSGDNNMYAIDLETGEKEWQFSTGGSVRSSAAVAGGRVYFGSDDGYLYAVDTTEGIEKWKKQGVGATYYPPAVAENIVYTGRSALNAQTGNILWESPRQTGGHSPTIANDTMYVFGLSESEQPVLYALNRKTGTVKTSVNISIQEGGHPPVIASGRVYVVNDTGYLQAFDTPS